MNDEDARELLKILYEISGCPEGTTIHDMVQKIIFENPSISMEDAFEPTSSGVYSYEEDPRR